MANITVSTSRPNVTVSTSNSVVSVEQTVSNIEIAAAPSVGQVLIRSFFTANAPLTYDNTSGEFGVDANALFTNKTTDDLSEGNTNLYYTDARSRSAISTVAPIDYDSANGVISIDESELFGGKTTDDLAEGNTNLYFTVDRVRSNISASGNILYDNNTGVISESLTTTDIDEGDSLYFTQQRARDSISVTAPVLYDGANGVISVDENALFSGKTTDDLTEGNTNLYYTDARVQTLLDTGVVDALFTGNVIVQGDVEVFGNVDFVTVEDLLVKDHEIVLNFGNASAQDAFITVDRSGSSLANAQIRWNESTDAWEFSNDGTNYQPIPTSTTDLSEGTNLYFSNARVNAFIQDSITTSDISEGTNLYFTEQRVRDSVGASGDLSYSNATGVFSVTTYKSSDFDSDFSGKTTTDLSEGTNLYYTTDRANTAISEYDGNIDTTGTITADGGFFGDVTGEITGNVTGQVSDISNFTTDDLTEGNTNLYYTDQRVVDAVLNNDIKFKSISETVVDAGNISGAVTFDVSLGTIHTATVTGNIIDITLSNLAVGGSLTIVLQQDLTGGHNLETGMLGPQTWNFTGSYSDLDPEPGAYNLLSLFFDGNEIFATLVGFEQTTTDNLPEGNTNLYYTDARARDSLSAAGNIVYDSNTGVISESLTTTDIDEGDNLYYTDTRARDSLSAGGDLSYDSANGVFSVTTYKSTDFDSDFGAKTTDDLAEGNTNLYYTDTKARDAISSGDNNIDYANGVITLSNTLSNVDTITSSTDTLLLQGVDSQQRILPGLTVDAQGYALLDNVANNFGDPLGDNFDWIQYSGNTAIETFAVGITSTQGSPTVQITAIQRRGEVIRGNTSPDFSLINNIVPGMVWRSTLTPASFPFPGGTVPKVISVDPGNNTITFDQVATDSTTIGGAANDVSQLINPAMHDETTGLSVLLRPDFDFNSASNTDTNTLLDTLIDSGPASMLPTSAVYAYPKTGFEPEDFVFSSGSASDYTIDSAKLGNVLVGKTTISPETGEINLARGLTIGENTNLTTRAVGTGQTPGFGINSVWNGLQQDYTTEGQAQSAIHQIYLGTFSDLTQGIPGRLYFSAFTGNANDNEFEWYPRGGECLGRIQWTAPTIRQGQGISTVNGPAAISVFAAKEFDTSFDSGMDMYLIASAHTDNRAQSGRGSDTFLSFERGEVVIASSQEFTGVFPNYDAQPHKSVKIAPSVPGPSESPRNRYTDQSTLWADFNYSNVSAKTGSRLAVTNGGSIGAGTVGDMVLDLERADNTGNVLTTWTTPFAAFKITNQGQFGSPTTFITVTSVFAGLSDGDPVIIDNVDEPAGSVLNGNVFYVQQSGNPVLNYRLWMNSDLDQPVNIGIDSTSAPDATIEFNVQSGVSAKTYSFRLAEQSNDLEILVDGSLHSTIKANGEIHNAAGSKYITETDFDTLFDARLAQEFPTLFDARIAQVFPTLLSDNAALIQQIAAGNVEPDYDGGTASTATFDFTVDGGDATTTEFTDTVEGGNAEGNSIVEGGFSSTTVYASTEDGGNASTTEFDQTIDGGNA